MDKYIDGRFERLEKALTNLIDSVAKYNPSLAHAKELKNADQDLYLALEEVQLHQNNYLRIQKLRQASLALDTQIRDTLTSLATTRKDIVTTHTTEFPDGPNYRFTYSELLNYARRISKTTLPPPNVLNTLLPQQGDSPAMAPQSAISHPGSTAQTPSATQAQTPVGGVPTSEFPSQHSLASTNTSLPENLSQHLNPLHNAIFFPWPLEDRFQSGALANNQHLLETGIDLKGYDPAEEAARLKKEEEERKQQEEKERLEREERENKMREEREKARIEREKRREAEQADSWRRGSVVGSAGVSGVPTAEKKQFQFTSLEDMDDD